MKITRNSEGFALPMTIVALTTLGLLSGAGFLVSWMELQAARFHDSGARAFHVAEAGLATVLASTGMPPATQTITLPAGSAVVFSEAVLDVGRRGSLLLFESTGTILDRGKPVSRAVSQVAWVGLAPAFDAALSVDVMAGPGSVSTGGASGYITGSTYGCTLPPGAAIAAAGPVTPGAVSVSGTPAVKVPGPQETVAARTGFRWSDITTGAIGAPDAVVPGDAWPSPGSGWPYVRLSAAGPLGPGHSGQGVIVADGDLEMANGFAWRGLVLIGGSLRVLGDVDLSGAVFAGLDALQSASIDLGSGIVSIAFDPCVAAQAARRLEPYPAAIPGTWREVW